MPTNDNTMTEILENLGKRIEEMKKSHKKGTDEEKRRREAEEIREFEHRLILIQRPQSMPPSLLPYLEPVTPMSNEEFISRIHEFVCIKYKSFNGLSGKSHEYQLVADDKPECKERVLAFLKEVHH